MKVLTKDVAAGTPVEFKFDASGSRFLIKNFTRSPISCKILDAAICIPATQARWSQPGRFRRPWRTTPTPSP